MYIWIHFRAACIYPKGQNEYVAVVRATLRQPTLRHLSVKLITVYMRLASSGQLGSRTVARASLHPWQQRMPRKLLVSSWLSALKNHFLIFDSFHKKTYQIHTKTQKKHRITKSKTKLENRFKKTKKSINNSKNKLRNL